MLSSGRATRQAAILLSALVAASQALAQGEPELFGARVRYGAGYRDGSLTDLGPGLSWRGTSPNDLALSGWYFGKGRLGVALAVQREAFALLEEQSRITGGGLWRVQLGPSGRWRAGPLRLEGLVGYGFSQLPDFGSSASPEFSAVRRHAALLAGRALVDLGLATVEAKGEYPFPLAVTAADGPARASGWGGGVALGIPLGRRDTLLYGVVLDYQYRSEKLTTARSTAGELIHRAGAALELRWLDQPPAPPAPRHGAALPAKQEPPKLGGLIIKVLDKESGAPIPLAGVKAVELDQLAGENGTLSLVQLPPGPLSLQVVAKGYRRAEEVAQVVAGRDSEVEIRLIREQAKPLATLTGLVRSTQGGKPIEAELEIPQLQIQTRADPKGAFSFRVAAGSYTVNISASGYRSQSKKVAVKDGDEAIFNVDLHPN